MTLFGTSGPGLTTLACEYDVGIGQVSVDKGPEPGAAALVVDGRLPLALVGGDMAVHVRIELRCDAEGGGDHDLLHVLDAALELVQPRRGALQAVGGADVEHQEA